MYLRAVHAELNIPALRNFIKQNPLGLLVTAIPSSNFSTIQCTHLPWLIDVQDDTSETELGKLRGHMAKPNPHSKAMTEAAQTRSPSNGRLTEEVSVIFNGPAHHYVTPKFYVETKPSTGKVVPTWNYSAVQAYGTATIYFDSKNEETGEYLQKQISDLSYHAETNVMGYSKPWGVNDAPDRYIELLRKNIIGIEVEITRLEGKYKMSQELGKGDREGVIKGFEELRTDDAVAIARTVEQRGALKEAQAQAA
ncbi:hypothetical protein PV05_04704 [Exophiala xenobiotica]|uniref:Transcriptional regulator n=1 Tax=Exophiala xenobiotica TaxID=348802 RepID=A0A0D2BU82_9EURO|nr:uncharacterized protein PV05_04704 [Exophiala xenobiotica]KIW56001.1 hypothetical protein PV05_04704 [Exophiala xenobiotica]